ncbi:MAG: GNAT family N-acetyltransferase [Caldilineaceae bacterium]|nr:GNAT family N-acetyltransferase [Caldilineaceae bacterium]
MNELQSYDALASSDKLDLREVIEADLSVFFAQQLDADAVHMAAFTAKNPADEAAFLAHWRRVLANPTGIVRTILCDGQVAGHVLRYEEDGKPEVSYWLGRTFWGRGIATRALARFLAEVDATRPIYARVAKDNLGSRRVLEKCGFVIIGADKGFANARGAEIEEWLLELRDVIEGIDNE